MNPPSRNPWPIIFVFAATVLCYWPVGGFEFSTWDDGINVSDNPHFDRPRIESVGFFWSHSFQRLYIPLTYTAWTLVAIAGQTGAADISGTKLNPYIFHLANLAVHLAASGVAYLILRQLVR